MKIERTIVQEFFEIAIIWLSILLICLAAAGTAHGQDMIWVTPNQDMMAWEAVTTMKDGTAIYAGHTVEYSVYRSPYPMVADPNDASLHELLGETTETNFTISFTQHGDWVCGVQSMLRRTSDGSILSRSETISWSSDPTVCVDGITFGWFYWTPPAVVSGLRYNP